MDRIPLSAEEREVFGKHVKTLRKTGLVPANVFGKGKESEAVTVAKVLFHKVYEEAGETGVIDLKIGAEKVRPVMIKNMQFDPVRGELLHVDFYQVDLNKPVKVYVPIKITGGEEIEKVKMGEGVVINPVSEVEVEALPADLIDEIEVNIDHLKEIDDAITVEQLSVNREKITIITPAEEVVVKLAPAITEEMQKLMEEQAAEAAAAAEVAEGEEGGEKVEGAEAVEGEEGAGEVGDESAEAGGGEEVEQAKSEE